MIPVSQILHRLRSRAVLFGIAVTLLVLNLGRLAVGYFEDRQTELDSRLVRLQQQRREAAALEDLRAAIVDLEERRKGVERLLFTGASEEQIASAMQILLQEKLAKTSLEPESLRPILRGGKDKGKAEEPFQELAIKLRLSGTLQDFVEFLADIYRSDQLFIIENFVLKPSRNDVLKILLDLKGFYQITPEKKEG